MVPTQAETRLGAHAFWAKVRRANGGALPSENECWAYPGKANRDGYKTHVVWLKHAAGPRKRRIQAHRLACRLAHGEPFGDQDVACHSCHNAGCVNPAHIHWGTHASNRLETVAVGKQAKGLGNGRTKLTEEQALTIISWTRLGLKIRTTLMAKEWGVDSKVIRQIRDRQTWVYLWERVEAKEAARVAAYAAATGITP